MTNQEVHARTAPGPQTLDLAQVCRITDDASAIAAAHELATRFRPGASGRDQTRELPWAQLAQWSESGLGGITVPREYGGADIRQYLFRSTP